MRTYHLMVYGGGNCEIAAHLEAEMNKLYQLQSPQLKIYAKTYILQNSCYAMYKRFSGIANEVEHVKNGGVYEYIYMSGEEHTKKQGLHMETSSDAVQFESFLREGVMLLESKEIILVLIGRSYGNGLFIDFSTEYPTQLRYEDFLKSLKKVGKEYSVKFHFILDIGSWHPLGLPFELSHLTSVASVFIWDREKAIDVVPLAEIIQKGIAKKEKLACITKWVEGYSIHIDSIKWSLCKLKWVVYRDEPCGSTWRKFYEYYKEVIKYRGHKPKGIITPLKSECVQDSTWEEGLSFQEVRHYFEDNYGIDLSEEDTKKWLSEMKKCISYHKL